MKPITYYQASNLSDEEVKCQFIVRKKEFDRVISEIRRDDMQGSVQHYIFIGQRGSGKSTLLRRIQAEINTDEELNSRLIAINLSEEQAGIYRLHDLWERVCQELREHKIEVEEVKWDDYGNDLTAFAKALYLAMQNAIQKEGKKIVLLLDNIDRILESIKVNDNHLFRELLMNYKDVRIIGGSTRLSEHHWKYDQPFYEFFSIMRLEPLTQDELRELLLFWSKFRDMPQLRKFIQDNPGRLDAVRILSDGMPRTMLYFVELLIEKPDQRGFDYLRYIIDRATPIYQERLGTLSPLHQKIVLEISFFWDAVKVKELSQTTRIESKNLSALLKQLVDLQIVEKIKGRGKNMMYRLKERFFNLWLIMTQGGPKEKSQVKWLTIFLETWYDTTELKALYSKFTAELMDGKIDADRAVVMTKALVHSKYLSIMERDELLDRAITIIGNKKEHLDHLPRKAKKIYEIVIELIGNEQFEKAQQELENLEQEDSMKQLMLGFIYKKQGNLKIAEKFLLKANESGDSEAPYFLGNLYFETNRYNEAEKYYSISIDKGDVDSMNRLGQLYAKSGRIHEAENVLLKAINKGDVDAMRELGEIYISLKRHKEARQYFLNAIEKGDTESITQIGLSYDFSGNEKKAEKYYLEAIEKGDSLALVIYAIKLYLENRDAEKAYELVVQYNSKIKGNINASAYEIIIALWSGRSEKLETAKELIDRLLIDKNLELLQGFINDILVHHQKNVVWEWFHDEKIGSVLKEMVKPFYHVTARLLNNKETGEDLLAQAPELKETVDSIYDYIIDRQKFYYNIK